MSLIQRLTLLAAVVTAASAACPSSDWTQYRDTCYWGSHYAHQWKDTRAACQTDFPGSDLVSIHDQDLNSFLTLNNDLMNDLYAWIGLARNTSASPWAWTDGSAVDFTNLYQDGPEEENCVYFFATGTWVAHDCDVANYYLCQIAAS